MPRWWSLPRECRLISESVEATLLILLFVIVAGPIVAERFGVPGLIGLIAGGMVVGPFVLGWVGPAGLLSQLGSIGLLYLMFLAGLSFNMRAFLENRKMAIVYGLLGFVLPFGLSMYVALSFSHLGLLAAALIGAMWASNTLVAYPDVLAAGLQTNRAVSAAVSAGVVADLLALSVLAIASSTAVIEIEGDLVTFASTPDPTLPVFLGIPILIASTLWGLPKIAEWFFVRVGHTRGQRFVFALVGMSAGALVAVLGGVEGLIGAFLAGLGMNRLVPSRGALMDRIEFVGGSLFIPAFLVSIGLSINPAVLFDLDTVILALLFTGLVVVGKTAAALITGFVFKIGMDEVGLMSALSFGQAASTLAIAQVGLSLGFFGQEIVNAAVLTIVSTALITSFATRFFARRVERPPKPEAALGDSVLVDVRPNDSDLKALMQFAGLISPDDGLVVPFAIPNTGLMDVATVLVDQAAAAAAEHGHDSTGLIRVDESFTNGALRLIEQADASLAIFSWAGLQFPSDFVFGNEIDRVGELSPIRMAAVRILGSWDRVVVATGDMSVPWKREDSLMAVSVAQRAAAQASCEMVVVTGDPDSLEAVLRPSELLRFVKSEKLSSQDLAELRTLDLVVVPAHTLAAARGFGQLRLARRFKDVSLAVVAGPHRLTVTTARAKTNARSFVGPTTPSR